MRLDPDPGYAAFQLQLREYLDGLHPEKTAAVKAEFDEDPVEIGPLNREFVRAMGRDGWLGVGIPVEHGGLGRTPYEQWLFYEEMAYRGLPYGFLTTTTIGPTISAIGTASQRNRYLPGILAGDLYFGIAYSEPDAGTDLASLRSRAVLAGDHWVINGQKIWTTNAHLATHLWLAARTGEPGSRHRGITLFVTPADAPGVSIREIHTQGDERTNEVFLTDVRIPADDVIGERDRGWDVITVQLNYERLFAHSDLRREFESLLGWLRRHGGDRTTAELAELAVDIEIDRAFARRNAQLLTSGRIPYAEASMAKIWHSELRQRLACVALDVLGPEAQLRGGDNVVPLRGRFERLYRRSTVLKFAGGTNEVMRDIVAQRGLGLPR